MKRSIGWLLGVGLLIMSGLPAAYAETSVSASTTTQINVSVSKLNAETADAAKADIAIKSLAKKYSVEASVITDLRNASCRRKPADDS